MRSWFTTGAALVLLTGGASAQTAGTYLSSADDLLLPPVVNLTQPGIAQSGNPATPNASGTVAGYDFGNRFKAQIEGVTARAAGPSVGNLPMGGNIAATSLMLKGLYEFTDGAWRLKPYVGAGVGLVDVNARILGAAHNDWAMAYQLQGGVTLGFTQKLMGSFEYRWTMGSKPHFSLAGIPTKLEIDRHGFVVGFNYKY